jgi:transposase-like protein
MSKIPQGEWNAIAARYAQGESISRIAQSYGCTPPAIHYILKRNRQRTGQPLDGRPTLSPAPATTQATPEQVTPERTSRAAAGENRATPDQAAAPLPVGDQKPAPPREMRSDQRQQVPQRQPGSPRNQGASAFTAGLDSELHGRAEAAIEAFRSSFDAALAEGSPVVRERLRQAASDLMRVAARTTIVLDRMNASVERTSFGAQDQLRSAHAGEHA